MRFGCAWLVNLCLFLLFFLELAPAANILAVFPFRNCSPFQVVRPLIRALVERDHNVTMVTPDDLLPDIEGVRHIRVPKLNKNMKELMDSDHFLNVLRSKWWEGVLAANMLYNISHAILSNDGVQRMLRDRSERFDMILLEATYLDALNGLADYYNATLVGMSSVRHNWNVEELAGNPAPSIYEPVSPIGYSMDHSLASMIYNWIFITEEKLVHGLIIRPAQFRVFKKFFGYSAQKFKDLRASFSVILVNSHFSMGRVRANVPNLIDVGGLHLSEAPEPCDADLQTFMDDAEHGVIYFSMGLDILVQYLPDNMQQLLLQAFSRLKQRVVWKNELTTTSNKTDKIYMIAKAPQRQVLAHPNVRLFITQGGLLSVMEAIHSGVPLLGLPLFFDHFSNIHRAKLCGMAEVLDSNNLNADTLTNTIRELLENPKYALKAKERSKLFRDRPMGPLETAVWWTEYALRHRDARHMRLNKEEISPFEYYRLDILLTYGLRIGFVIGVLIFLGFRLFRSYRQSQSHLEQRERVFMLIMNESNL